MDYVDRVAFGMDRAEMPAERGSLDAARAAGQFYHFSATEIFERWVFGFSETEKELMLPLCRHAAAILLPLVPRNKKATPDGMA